MLIVGDCVEVMRGLPENSVDAVVADPPYGLAFMGKEFDKLGESKAMQAWHEAWAREALRALKPGGFMLAFGGTRTYHRLACAIEDAGFEVRDSIMWIYGQGFPKSLDVSKAIDKAARRAYVLAAVALGLSIPGNNMHDWTKAEHAPGDAWWARFKEVLTSDQWSAIERKVLGPSPNGFGPNQGSSLTHNMQANPDITAPATPEAETWQGWGTALKPAHEPICVARKPLSEPSVARNVLRWGTGALNIDGCRIGTDENTGRSCAGGFGPNFMDDDWTPPERAQNGGAAGGRWPANLILSPEAAEEMDRQTGTLKSGGKAGASYKQNKMGTYTPGEDQVSDFFGSEGGASRFFYCAKSSRAERSAGLDSIEIVTVECNAWGSEAQRVRLRVDTAQSPPRVIAGFGIPESDVIEWNTFLFGNGTTAPSLAENRFITLTGTSSTTGSKTLGWLTRSLTSGCIADANSVTENGGSPAASAEKCSPFLSFTNARTVSLPGARDVPSATPWLIRSDGAATSDHPTVKPLALMQWLVRLVTPPGGVVLDPFAGSGTTGVAAILEGFEPLLIEREAEYAEISNARLGWARKMAAQEVLPLEMK